MKRFKLLFSLGMMLILSYSAWAGVPKAINFQGILTNSGGTPLADSIVSVEFRIYTALVGGESKWVETQSVITDNQGRFNVLLGAVSSIEDTVFKDTTRYLGVKVSTDAELIPRTRLVSVAYSNRVSTIDGAKGGTIFGNTSIQSDLTVNGVIDATGQSSKIRFHYNDVTDFPSAATYHGMFAHAHNQGAVYYAHAGSWIKLADSLHFHNSLAASDLSPNPALYVDTAGKVGIGIGATSPSGKLDVLNSVSSAFTEQGVNGVVSNSSTGSAFGGTFTAGSAGTGTHTGVRGNASGSSFNPAYGVYGGADNSSSGDAYGGFFNVSTGGTGTGPHYAVWGSSFGISGPVYGGYFFTDTTGTGTKYGVYATAPTSEGYAGYFQGRVIATGFVGFGTSNPAQALHVSQNGTNTAVMIDDPTARCRLGMISGSFDNSEFGYKTNLVMGTITDNTFAGFSEKVRITNSGNVGIGTTSPQGVLDVNSTTGALIVPRMTTAQRDLLSPVNGMIIYNTTTNQFNFYEAGAWVTK